MQRAVPGDIPPETGLFYVEGGTPADDRILVQSLHWPARRTERFEIIQILFKPNKIINKHKKYYLKRMNPIHFNSPVAGTTETTLLEPVDVYLTETKPFEQGSSAFHPRVFAHEARMASWGLRKWAKELITGKSSSNTFESAPLSATFTIHKDTPINVEYRTIRNNDTGINYPVLAITIEMDTPIETSTVKKNYTYVNLSRLSAKKRAAEAEAEERERIAVAAAAAAVEAPTSATAGAGTPLEPEFDNGVATSGFSLPPIIGNYSTRVAGASGGRRRRATRSRKPARRHKRRHTRRH
jgi:hypothetical protein